MVPGTRILVRTALLCGAALAPLAQAAERWRCELDLHQGDTGLLEFGRDGDRIDGRIVVRRGASEQAISGRWSGEDVRFRRVLSDTSQQPFRGVAVALDDGQVSMGGRFAAGLQGVWSADCRPDATRPPVPRPTRQLPAPETERRGADTQPPRVRVEVDGILVLTLGDRIRIRASAEDDTRVASITVYVDERAVKTCPAWECWYSEQPAEPGPHSFRAEAEDLSGNRGRSETLEFMVHPTSKPGPSLNTRTDPYQPTSNDRVRFIARASHASGVRDVTIHVDGRPVRTCSAEGCEYSGGPYPAGTVRWRVSARSRDGGETYGSDRTLQVRSAPPSGECSISGRAAGPRADVARVFFINVYGPDDERRFRETARFDAGGRWRVSGLPAGRYRLVVDTRADTAVGAHPSSRLVDCRGGEVSGVDFEFR